MLMQVVRIHGSASEVTLSYMGEIDHYTTKRELCAYFMEYTVHSKIRCIRSMTSRASVDEKVPISE